MLLAISKGGIEVVGLTCTRSVETPNGLNAPLEAETQD